MNFENESESYKNYKKSEKEILEEKAWFVIKNTDFTSNVKNVILNKAYRLRKDDVFKVGKIIFRVLDVQTDQDIQTKKDKEKDELFKNDKYSSIINESHADPNMSNNLLISKKQNTPDISTIKA